LEDAFELAGGAGQKSAKGRVGGLHLRQIIFADDGQGGQVGGGTQILGFQPGLLQAAGKAWGVRGEVGKEGGKGHGKAE